MSYCTHCGHQVKVGRYCTNCGQPVSVPPVAEDAPVQAPAAPPTQTAPPVVTPRVPPPGSVPPAPRYPLYAETVAPPPAATPPPVGFSGAPTPPTASPAPPAPGGPARVRRDWLPWLIVVLFLAVLATAGSALLLLDSGGGERPTAEDTGNARGSDDDDPPDDPPGGEPGDLTAKADAEAPAVAPQSRDNQGNRVTFAADNMLDGDPRTSWRMAGDGTDAVLTFTFDDTVEIDEVGLINGYAKTDPPNDWYVANRRILSVSWVFDDGTEITQELEESRSVQTMAIDPVETGQVQLRILEVSAPARGPSGRDFTAVSDVAFGGSGGRAVER